MSNTGTIEVYRDINIDSDSGSDSELAMINGNETETSKEQDNNQFQPIPIHSGSGRVSALSTTLEQMFWIGQETATTPKDDKKGEQISTTPVGGIIKNTIKLGAKRIKLDK